MSDSSNQGEHALRAARGLLDAGRVLEVRSAQGGQVVTGVVSAEGGGRHRVYLRRAGASFKGECSCGADTCVHSLAVSLAAQQAPLERAQPAPAGRASLTGTSAGAAVSQRLHYVLEAPSGRHSLTWHVSLWIVQTDSGSPPQRFAPRVGLGAGEYPRYVDGDDRAVLQGLAASGSTGPWALAGEAGGRLLRLILATGRARVGALSAPPLHPVEPCPVSLAWRIDEEGLQHLACEPGSLSLILGTEPPFAADLASGGAGRLELSFPAQLLRECWPLRLAPEEVDELRQSLGEERGFPLPAPLPVRHEAHTVLAGRLSLAAGPQAQVSLLYNGRPVRLTRLDGVGARVRVLAGGPAGAAEVLELPRDRAGEARLRAQVAPWLPPAPGSDRDWLRLIVEGVPALRGEGWEVQIDADFPYRLVTPGEWYADARAQPRGTWFDLKLGVLVDGEPVNLLPALTRYLEGSPDTGAAGQDALLWESTADSPCGRIGGHWLLRLADGRHLALPMERIRRICDTLVELLERPSLREDALTLPRSQSARLAQLAGELGDLAPLGDDPSLWMSRQTLEQLSHPAQVAAPAGFPAQLRPYQESGLGWLQALRRHDHGGLLADDMGLGKTVQTLAHLAVEKEAGRLTLPALIAAPVSALVTWEREIRRFMPELRWVLWHGGRRRELTPALAGAEVILTGYPLLTLDAEVLCAQEYSLVILDEAQAIKNPHAKVSVAVRSLRAAQRICLTGTPVENHLGELWSLYEFLQPGLLGTESAFARHYRTPIEKNGNRARQAALSARIAPFLLRRTKESVATELPPKTEILQSILLSERQRDFYDGIRLAMHRRVREIIETQGIIRSQITILDALMKLRQACCDPRLVKLAAAEGGLPEQDEPVPSAKLDWLAQVIPQLVAEGRRILLFSQFTSMLRLIEEQLKILSVPYCLLTGATRDRGTVVERFQAGGAPLFLISLKAGGTALNLTAADTVIHYDPWWNPAAEAQATDRAYRIGQDKPVFVYKLIAAGTLEERIIDLQKTKRSLAAAIYGEGGGEGLGALTEREVAELFAP